MRHNPPPFNSAPPRLHLRALLLASWILLTPAACAAENAQTPQPWKATARGLQVRVWPDGRYEVSVGGDNWFKSGATAFHIGGTWYSTRPGLAQKPLILQGARSFQSSDSMGSYEGLEERWLAGKTAYYTTFRVYAEDSVVVFEQSFPDGAADTSIGMTPEQSAEFERHHRFGSTGRVLSAFPTFISGGKIADLGSLTYAGNHAGIRRSVGVMGIPDGTDAGSPLALFDRNLKTAILSPLGNFMAGVQSRAAIFGGDWVCGIQGLMRSIPKGFRYETILYAGQGINQTFYDWGSHLLSYHGKTRNGPSNDPTVTHLGYWTDNGAYYYYHTEKGKNYEQTLKDVRAYHRAQRLPFNYYQLDSWWYYKGKSQGVTDWSPRTDVFPHGLVALHQSLGLPLVTHNRWWDSATGYATQFHFIREKETALPDDQRFWDSLMGRLKQNGGAVYEQDWLIDQFHKMEALHTDVGLGRRWLTQMGRAAQDNGLTIQYCMALPSEFLESSEIPAVTQIRVSDDYHPGNGQWKIGGTSLLAWSLGLAPFKDTFWSTTTQPGDPYHGATEPNAELQTLVSALSAGPIGPGDGIGYANTPLLMRVCRKDGLLLKPDKPATPLDRSLLPDATRGQVWSAYTTIGDHRWHYVLIADTRNPFLLLADDLESPGPLLACDYHTGASAVVDGAHPLDLQAADRGEKHVPFSYYVLAPRQSDGWAFLGEAGKYITVSRQRFSSISPDEMTVDVLGLPGEQVSLCWSAPQSPQTVSAAGAPIHAVPLIKTSSATSGWTYDASRRFLRVNVVIPAKGALQVIVRH